MSPPSDVSLCTSDGVRLAAQHWAPRGEPASAIGCVAAHGFTMSSRNPHVRRLCRGLADQGLGVLAPDFRGHGRSGGVGTAGAEEIHDIAAAVAWLRARGYGFVAVVGWSMGGTAVLRHAGLGGDADAVVSVSAPGVWFERGTRAMRVVHWMFEHRTGRVTARYLRRTRVSPDGWQTLPETPAEVWIEPAMGHAEVATTDELVGRIAGWITRAANGELDPAPIHETTTAPAVCDDERRD